MAQLFVEEQDRRWAAHNLAPEQNIDLSRMNPPINEADRFTNSAPGDARLLPAANTRSGWILLSGEHPRAVTVNGLPLPTGLRVLRDRDEIRTAAGLHAYFSTETLPEVQPFPGTAEPAARCPRCKLALTDGTPSVRCPHCAIWYHQIEGERACWTRHAECEVCKHTTALNAELQWCPADL